VKICGQCDFVYLENPPDYDDLQSDFPWEKTMKTERERRKAAEPIFQGIADMTKPIGRKFKQDKLTPLSRRYFASGSVVVDVGCGKGHHVKRLGELGFVPCGVEISKALAETASSQAATFGGRVVVSNAVDGLDQFPDRSFAGAILISFLEHESNPSPLLRKLRQKLVTGGKIIIKVPNFGSWNSFLRGARWCGWRFPDHVNYFTPKTLRELVRRAGFALTRFQFKDRFPFNDNMWMVCQAN
jgi:SAM-dependent methyltransferase